MPTVRLNLSPLDDRSVPTILPAGFAESVLASGLDRPTAVAVAPDGRAFVAEQTGTLRVVENGTPSPVLAVTTDSSGERGLVGLALDPNFTSNGFIYVYYTVPGAPAHNRVSRFAGGAETVLLDLDPLTGATNHNGGALAFGPDGKLYVAVGENNTAANAQSLANRLGKVLRVNPDGSIPADNPSTFEGLSGTTSGANRAIYAVGLRNPFNLAFSPTTGQLLINDVGQNTFEEVNPGRAGANYGWPATEGAFDRAAFPAFTPPVYAYPHQGTQPFAGEAVTGGAFAADGTYYFTDFVAGWIDRLDPATGAVTSFATDLTGGLPTGLAFTPAGDLLYLSIQTGSIYRIAEVLPPPSPPGPPPPAAGVVAVGAGPGGPAVAKLIDPATGKTLLSVDAFPGFAGGVRVAAADVTGDGVADLVAGAGPGGGPNVKVFDGATGRQVYSFFAFESTFVGGVFVAAGDLDGDGSADVVVTPAAGGGARVKVFGGRDGAVLADYFAFADPNFRGGLTAAVGDFDTDGRPDLAAGVASGGGPRVVVVPGGLGGPPTVSVLVFDAAFAGGAFVAAGDLTGDGRADLVVTPGVGGGPVVTVFDGTRLAGPPAAVFAAGDPAARGGVTVAVRGSEIVVGTGPGGRPTVGRFRADGTALGEVLAFDETFAGGMFVG